MEKWECYRCSYVIEDENPPEECPSCHYSGDLLDRARQGEPAHGQELREVEPVEAGSLAAASWTPPS